MEKIEFVRLGVEDAAELQQLDSLCFRHPWSQESYLHELRDNKAAYYYGCLVNGELVSFAGFWLLLDEAHITNIGTHPEHRRHGLAEWMLRRTAVEIMRLGAGSVTLEVRSQNLPAISLYEKLGFRSAGIRPGYYDDPRDDAVIMWWKLYDASTD